MLNEVKSRSLSGKKSISIISSIVAFVALVAFTPVMDGTGFYRIDTVASSVEWSGSKITGKVHSGTVNLLSGGLQLTNGVINNGKFTIDMTSLAVTDLSGGMKTKLEGHLKGDDFFGVEKFKTANINITGTNVAGNVIAELTIKGITNPISFPVTIEAVDNDLTVTATIEVDRSQFDVRYGSDSFFDNLGDKTIDNIIKFNVTLKGQTK